MYSKPSSILITTYWYCSYPSNFIHLNYSKLSLQILHVANKISLLVSYNANKMLAHIKRILVKDYFVVNITDDSCLVFLIHHRCLYQYQQYVVLSIGIPIVLAFYHISGILNEYGGVLHIAVISSIRLGLCDNSKTYISIMHYNIIFITILS